MPQGWERRVTRLTVCPDGEPIYSELCTHIEIEEDGGREIIKVTQQSGHIEADKQSISLVNINEWKAIKDAVAELMPNVTTNQLKQ